MATTCINGVPQNERDALTLTASATTTDATAASLAEIEIRPGQTLWVEAEIISSKADATTHSSSTYREAFRRVGSANATASVGAVGDALGVTVEGAGVASPPAIQIKSGSPNIIEVKVTGRAAQTWRHTAVVRAFATVEG